MSNQIHFSTRILGLPKHCGVSVSRGNWGGGGGVELDFNSLSKQKQVKFATEAPDWRVIASGLNLRGRCQKIGCPAYNHIVWINKGFGRFNMGKHAYTSVCPICKQIAKDVDNFAFSNCKYKIKGKRINDAERLHPEIKETVDGGEYTTFEQENTLTKWNFLKVVTMKKG